MRRFVFYNASSGLDSDALAYFASNTAITNDLDKAAINDFYKGLKADGIYNLIGAMYLPIWASAANNKWNLKDPRDLDAAFRLTFSGGWTHASTGALPNGTNGYANTYYSMSANQSLTSHHFAIYSRTSIASGSTFGSSGIRDSSTGLGFQLAMRRKDNLRYAAAPSEGVGSVANGGAESDARGFYIGSRTANNSIFLKKNNATIAINTNTNTDTTLSTRFYFLSAINQLGSPQSAAYDNKEIAFSSIGNGLSEAQADLLYSRVQTLMTYFGINV